MRLRALKSIYENLIGDTERNLVRRSIIVHGVIKCNIINNGAAFVIPWNYYNNQGIIMCWLNRGLNSDEKLKIWTRWSI